MNNKIQIILTNDQLQALQLQTLLAVKQGIKQATADQSKPFLNLKDFTAWTGFTAPTIRKFVENGLPVADVNGQKLYGKEDYIKWLKSQEKVTEKA
ncbi:DNA-binding protein [Limosilactobacillus pontis]|uniref:DNA-binding protein n=1 Tax=Limosilactobacillus pontis TaxID=35787 RepID=UPI0025A42E34|nr:DNA-binding protein [Limosilactobacillus pontis]MDM8332717.1 DNA-binding protein [Limosilactobacillus pontis]